MHLTWTKCSLWHNIHKDFDVKGSLFIVENDFALVSILYKLYKVEFGWFLADLVNLNHKINAFLVPLNETFRISGGRPPNHKMVGLFKHCYIILISLSTWFCNCLGWLTVVFRRNIMPLKSINSVRQAKMCLWKHFSLKGYD